jgi:hypothetical protein
MRWILLGLLCAVVLSTTVQPVRKLAPVANCYLTLSTGKCAECIFGFAIVNETCQSTQNKNCKTFDPFKGVCTGCYVGYSLVSNGSCVVNASADVFQHCSFLLFGTYCLSCEGGYYFNYDGNCEVIDPNCNVFDYVFDICTTCDTGYTYSQSRGQCVSKTMPPDAGCTSWIGDVCFSCLNGWTLYDGICVVANPECRLRLPNYPFDCGACFPGYVLSGTDCVAEPVNNPLCAESYLNGTCKKCSFRSIKNSLGVCVSVSTQCKTWNGNGRCTSCYGGYLLNSGNCILPSDPNCLLWSGNKCVQCIPWTYYDGSKCVQVSTVCRTYTPSNGLCTSCYQGWLLKNGSCIVNPDQNCRVVASDGTCTSCYGGYYYNLAQGKCLVGNALCNGMDFYGKCLGCYGGYYLKDGQCYVQDPLCASFNYSTLKCSSCYTGYTLTDGLCK